MFRVKVDLNAHDDDHQDLLLPLTTTNQCPSKEEEEEKEVMKDFSIAGVFVSGLAIHYTFVVMTMKLITETSDVVPAIYPVLYSLQQTSTVFYIARLRYPKQQIKEFFLFFYVGLAFSYCIYCWTIVFYTVGPIFFVIGYFCLLGSWLQRLSAVYRPSIATLQPPS